MSTVAADSLITLHYALSLDDGEMLISTFDTSPATLQLGSGELSPGLEACLIDLPIGECYTFLLDPGQAFGDIDPLRVQTLPRSDLPDEATVGSLIEFEALGGQRFTGIVRALDAQSAQVDFNHPLAGRALRFEVQVIGVS